MSPDLLRRTLVDILDLLREIALIGDDQSDAALMKTGATDARKRGEMYVLARQKALMAEVKLSGLLRELAG